MYLILSFFLLFLIPSINAWSFEYHDLKSGMTIAEARKVIENRYDKLQEDGKFFLAWYVRNGQPQNVLSVNFNCEGRLITIIDNFDTNGTLREFTMIAAQYIKLYGSKTLVTTDSRYINADFGEAKELNLIWGGDNEIMLSAYTYSDGAANISVSMIDNRLSCKQ